MCPTLKEVFRIPPHHPQSLAMSVSDDSNISERVEVTSMTILRTTHCFQALPLVPRIATAHRRGYNIKRKIHDCHGEISPRGLFTDSAHSSSTLASSSTAAVATPCVHNLSSSRRPDAQNGPGSVQRGTASRGSH